MKFKALFILAAGVVLASCTSQAGFSVKVLGAGDAKVEVIDMLSGEAIASGIGDELQLAGKAAKDALLAVQKEDDDWQTPFFNDGTPVTVNLGDHCLQGSELNEKVTEYDLSFSDKIESINKGFEELEGLSAEEQVIKSAALQAIIQEFMGGYKTLLEENHDNIIPVAFMPAIFSYLDEEDLQEELKPEYAYTKHPYTQKYVDLLEKQKESEKAEAEEAQKIIGTKFIDLEEPDVNGVNHKLSEYVGTGKWVLVDFWASWCGPCRREMPNVVEAYKKYSPKGFDIVGLSFDNDKDAWVKAIDELDMPWHHLSDLQGWKSVASDVYGIHAIPASLLVDPEGTIVARDLRGSALGAKLAEIFGE